MRAARAVLALALTLGTFYTGLSLPQPEKHPARGLTYTAAASVQRWQHFDLREASRSAHKRTTLPKHLHTNAAPRTAYYTGNTVWDLLAACESGGNWAINTGNGYAGGVQVDMSFWRSYGGLAFAPRPDLATREQQIIVASRAQRTRGFHPWPACSAKLGLR